MRNFLGLGCRLLLAVGARVLQIHDCTYDFEQGFGFQVDYCMFKVQGLGVVSLEDATTGQAIIFDDNSGHVHLRRVGHGRRGNRVVPVRVQESSATSIFEPENPKHQAF